ncbi:MAG: DUF4363 family protein [Firmicutes bacterium]|nr:DUF4363 family protein [Bacillota bacterium]
MRALSIVILIILVIISGWIFLYNDITKDYDEFITSLNKLNKQLVYENWDEANKELEVLLEKWKEHRDKWSIFLDHHEIDNIDISMAKTSRYVETKNNPLALGEIEVLIKLFEIVKENEAFTLTNIL